MRKTRLVWVYEKWHVLAHNGNYLALFCCVHMCNVFFFSEIEIVKVRPQKHSYVVSFFIIIIDYSR